MRAGTLAIGALSVSLGLPAAAGAAPPASCGLTSPDRVVTGSFAAERQGAFVFVPFDVPAGTTQVRVAYCHDQPEAPTGGQSQHTLDLGLYEPRDPGERVWGVDEFRGWGGSGYKDVTITPQGFSSEAQYRANPKQHVPGRTTRSFRPGRIPAGRWGAELGLANIANLAGGDLDQRVAFRVEIDLSSNPAFAANPYRGATYDDDSASERSRWYAGDFHVHAEHSGDARTTMREAFDYAFAKRSDGGAGLDFLTLTDHNTDSAWREIGRLQADHPDKLIVRSQEVTTYLGHAQNHASLQQSDYRTGPLYERRPDGSLALLRGARPASGLLGTVKREGGFTQINHPTLFPSPPFPPNLCRGCEWEYSEGATDYSKVDAVEIATGPPGIREPPRPGPNPFTLTAIQFWEDKLAAGHKIAAVGGSDSHDAGRTPNPAIQAPIGTPTTMVFADELSEDGIERAVEAGHTFVKVFGGDSPDLRFSADVEGSGGRGIMGDTVHGAEVTFTARVLGAAPGPDGPLQLVVLKDGVPFDTVPITSDDFTHRFEAAGLGRYRLQVQRASAIEAVASPIYVEAARRGDRSGGAGGGGGGGGGAGAGGGGGSSDDLGGSAGREAAAAAGGGDAGGQGDDDLPFTGLSLALLVLSGAALLSGGTLLRGRGQGR